MRFSGKVAVVSVLALPLALAACGQRAELKPPKGAMLPPAPYGVSERPNSTALLKTPTIAIPERNLELRTKSETREDDPFNLPPPEKPDPTATSTPTDAPTPTETPSTGAQGN
ncbi:hypothetical protein [Novosphingobium sp. 9]|uniref:hypothetical protein n=1 Tax=Novosphingobium sp. 9 TaxID=2025349 RepID=UPI0021B5DA62|nr:hypothetical protein [Novosphingobium sp. 9]